MHKKRDRDLPVLVEGGELNVDKKSKGVSTFLNVT